MPKTRAALNKIVAGIPFNGEAQNYLNKTTAGLGTKPDLNLPTVTQAQADVRDKEGPTLGETTGAAFSEFNLTKSIYDSIDMKHSIDLNYNKQERFDELTKGIPQEFHKDFTGMSLAEDEQIRLRVLKRMKDQETQANSGMTGVGIAALAMVADPIGLGFFGAEAKILSRVLTKGKRASNALFHAGSSAGTMVAYEDALHSAHGTSMDAEDVLHAAAGGFVFGGALGALSKGTQQMNRELFKAGKNVQKALDDELIAGVEHIPMTMEEALVRAADEPMPVFQPLSRPKEAAKARTLRVDIAEMEAMKAKTKADISAELGAPRNAQEADVLATRLLEVDDLYNLILETAKTKLDDLDARLGDVSVQKTAHVNKRAQELLKQNSDMIAASKKVKPKPVDISAPDESFSMFKQARMAIEESFDRVVKNDGSTMGMFVPFAGGEAKAGAEAVESGVKSVLTDVATDENALKEFAVRVGAGAKVRLAEEARKLSKTGVFKALETTAGKIQRTIKATDSAFLLDGSDAERYFQWHFLENAAGTTTRTSSAAMKKSVNDALLLTEIMPPFREYVASFKKRTGVRRWFPGTKWADDLNTELRTEMELRTNAYNTGTKHVAPHNADTIAMADALDKANAQALELLQVSGAYGAEKVGARPGYVQLLWQGRALRKAALIKGLPEAYQKALAESYVEATGMSLADATKVSKAVLLRAKRKDLGLDSNPHALLSKDSREFFRSTLENSESMSPEEIDALLARIDATMADSGASARMKRRTNVDLLKTFEHEGQQYSLLDLVDNNMPMLAARYMGEASGRSALAAKGITSEAEWTAMREAIVELASEHGASPEHIAHLKSVIAGTYDQLLSRPAAGGVNRHARRLMDGAQLAILNQAGLPQIAEFSQILGAHGLRNMWEILPAVRAFRRSVQTGELSKDILSDISPWTGRIWDEHMLYRTDIRLDDKLGHDATWLKRLDRLTASAKDLSGWASGMYSIKRMQQQMTVALQAGKVAKFVKGMKITDNGVQLTGEFAGQEARLADVGWDMDFLKRMKTVEKHFEWDGDTIQRLNIQEWHDPILTEQFIEGIHRHTHQLIQRPMVGETHIWMHNTVGAMLTQFRNYPLVGIEKQTLRNIRFADEQAFYTTMYGLGMSSLVYTSKVAINAQGKSDKDKKKYLDERLSTSGMFKGAMMYAGVTSVGQDVINGLGAVGLAPSAMVSTQVSRSGGTRGVDFSIKDIPSLGFATNGINAVGGLIKNTIDPSYKYSKKDTNALQGATILGNHYLTAMLFNELDAAVEDH